MREKLKALTLVREDIGEDRFRYAAGRVIAKHYVECMTDKGYEFCRRDILDKTNLVLIALGTKEVSYTFLRHIGY